MSASPGFALFDTAVGRCAIVWRGDAVIGTALPEASDAATRARVLRRYADAVEGAAPAPIAIASEAITHLLAGDDVDLRGITLDLESCSRFERAVYAAAAAIPRGSVLTYGALAASIGSPGAARAVGVALARNPVPIIIPCHRIVAQGGGTGGFSAPGGVSTKFRLLEIEGAGGGDGLLFDDLPLAAAPSRSA
jgi:methylated-DNA-[protein]-cysteine S-methyltransferase